MHGKTKGMSLGASTMSRTIPVEAWRTSSATSKRCDLDILQPSHLPTWRNMDFKMVKKLTWLQFLTRVAMLPAMVADGWRSIAEPLALMFHLYYQTMAPASRALVAIAWFWANVNLRSALNLAMETLLVAPWLRSSSVTLMRHFFWTLELSSNWASSLTVATTVCTARLLEVIFIWSAEMDFWRFDFCLVTLDLLVTTLQPITVVTTLQAPTEKLNAQLLMATDFQLSVSNLAHLLTMPSLMKSSTWSQRLI